MYLAGCLVILSTTVSCQGILINIVFMYDNTENSTTSSVSSLLPTQNQCLDSNVSVSNSE